MGLLTGVMSGLGRGMAQSGEFLMRVTADEEKEARLRKYEESVRKRQWEREDRQRLEDREWSVEDRDHGADLTRWQVGEQQAGQDRRTAATVGASNYRTNAGLMQRGQDAEGNTVWFNPATDQRVQAPEGWLMVGGEGMSDREKDAMSTLRSQYRDLTSMFDPFLEEGPKQELQGKLDDVYRQMERINPLLARQIAEEETGGDAVDEYLNQF